MSLINTGKSGNPALSERIFRNVQNIYDGTSMTAQGTLLKFFFLFIMVLASASFSWNLYSNGKFTLVNQLMIAGVIIGLVIALILMFKPQISNILAPVYGLAEGLFLGGISAFFNRAFDGSEGAFGNYPNIIIHAVILTFSVVIAMFLLYYFKVIKVTEQLKSVVYMATIGIAITYFLSWIFSLFGSNFGFINGNGMFGIIFSVIVVGIASLNLLLDFDRIEELSKQNAPKFMEWYCAFGLLVTIVWLYIEILRLLIKLVGSSSSRD